MCPTPTSLQRSTRRRPRSGRSLTGPGSMWPRGGRGYRSIVPSTSGWSNASWRRLGPVICRCCSTCSHPTWCWSPTAAARWPLSGVRWWAATEWRPSSPASRRSCRMRWSALCGSTARPPAGSISPASSTRRSAWWSWTAGSPASTRSATRTSWGGWKRWRSCGGDGPTVAAWQMMPGKTRPWSRWDEHSHCCMARVRCVCDLFSIHSALLPPYSPQPEPEYPCLLLLARFDLHRGGLLGDRRHYRFPPAQPSDRLDLLRHRLDRSGGPLRWRVRRLRPTGASPPTSRRRGDALAAGLVLDAIHRPHRILAPAVPHWSAARHSLATFRVGEWGRDLSGSGLVVGHLTHCRP